MNRLKYLDRVAIKPVLLLTGFLLLQVPALVIAQTISIEQPRHELKVYRNLESRQLFWPKDLPAYVWLSTSSEQNSPKHRLESASLKDEEGYEPLEQSRIELELSGNQYMRWINYDTKDTLLLQFQADGISPKSLIHLTGADTHKTESVEFIGKGLKATFEAVDHNSGVENIYVSVNGADFSPYFGTYDFNQEKDYSVYFYAVDNVGNVEEVLNKEFTVDLTSPTTKHNLQGIHQGSILSPYSEITLTSNDELSGVELITYSFNNSSSSTIYSVPISISSLGEGAHTLYYSSIDYVNNVEKNNAFEFYLDRTPPETQLVIEGDQYQGSSLFVSNRTLYRLNVSDNKTGISSSKYQINASAEENYQSGTFALPETSDTYALTFWSTDNVNNVEEKNSQELILDTTAPQSSHRFDGVSFTQRGSTWIPSSTKLVLQASDAESGVQNIRYSIESETQEATYSNALVFNNEGRYSINYWGVDRVNNGEPKRPLSIVVDNTPPNLIINFSSAKIGSANAEDSSVLDLYPVNTVMYLAATDESSGADGMWFSVNDEQEEAFTSPLAFDSLGEQKVTLRSVDRVGNETVQILRFIISE